MDVNLALTALPTCLHGLGGDGADKGTPSCSLQMNE